MDPRIAPSLISFSLALHGCSSLRALAREQRREEARQEREDVCPDDRRSTLPAATSILRPETIRSVEPLHVLAGRRKPVETLVGARLHLAGDAALTPRALVRALRCYETEAVLRDEELLQASDPFWLSEGRVRFAVRNEESGLVIELRAVPAIRAPELLERARAYAAQNGG